MWNCFRQLLDILGTPEMLDRARLSLTNFGLRTAMRNKVSSFWASLAEALPTIRERHPSIADQFCVALQRGDRVSTSSLQLIAGSNSWGAVSIVLNGDVAWDLGPGQISVDPKPGVRKGWQRGGCVAAIAPQGRG